MVTFEEQFPSLKCTIGGWSEDCDTILVEDVFSNCLDKQKVREAIEKYTIILEEEEADCSIMIKLRKELGL